MRLSLLVPLGIAAFSGIMSIDTPDANALTRSTTVVSGPRGTAVVTRRPRRVAVIGGLRGARGAVVVSRPGLRTCRTVIVNGVRTRRCF
jgi:hypothetical protein